MSIISPLILKTIARTISTPYRLPSFDSGEIQYPPVQGKLIAWLRDGNTITGLKEDLINGYNFTYFDCPGNAILDGFSNPVFDAKGDPIYSAGNNTANWGCKYQAPVQGQPGYTQLIAVDDDDTLYGSGSPQPPNILNKTILEAILNDNMFFNASSTKGFAIYDLTLTASELTTIRAWFGYA